MNDKLETVLLEVAPLRRAVHNLIAEKADLGSASSVSSAFSVNENRERKDAIVDLYRALLDAYPTLTATTKATPSPDDPSVSQPAPPPSPSNSEHQTLFCSLSGLYIRYSYVVAAHLVPKKAGVVYAEPLEFPNNDINHPRNTLLLYKVCFQSLPWET